MSSPSGSPTRGQEVTIRVAVDGDPKQGSMLRVNNFTATPQQELPELEYLGETETDYDFQHNGFSLQWEIHQSDATSIDMLDDAVNRERQHLAPRGVTITVIYEYRDDSTPGRIVVYRQAKIMQGDEGFKGRKDHNSVQYTCKARRRSTLQA
jgi:hypothetical protein